MIRRALFVLTLIGLAGGLIACDGRDVFVIGNTLPKAIVLQIIDHDRFGRDADFILDVARGEEKFEPSMRLAPGETASIFTEGVSGGRTDYVVVIYDESGKELFRGTFRRDELVKHKFKLQVTERGIEYPP